MEKYYLYFLILTVTINAAESRYFEERNIAGKNINQIKELLQNLELTSDQHNKDDKENINNDSSSSDESKLSVTDEKEDNKIEETNESDDNINRSKENESLQTRNENEDDNIKKAKDVHLVFLNKYNKHYEKNDNQNYQNIEETKNGETDNNDHKALVGLNEQFSCKGKLCETNDAGTIYKLLCVKDRCAFQKVGNGEIQTPLIHKDKMEDTYLGEALDEIEEALIRYFDNVRVYADESATDLYYKLRCKNKHCEFEAVERKNNVNEYQKNRDITTIHDILNNIEYDLKHNSDKETLRCKGTNCKKKFVDKTLKRNRYDKDDDDDGDGRNSYRYGYDKKIGNDIKKFEQFFDYLEDAIISNYVNRESKCKKKTCDEDEVARTYDLLCIGGKCDLETNDDNLLLDIQSDLKRSSMINNNNLRCRQGRYTFRRDRYDDNILNNHRTYTSIKHDQINEEMGKLDGILTHLEDILVNNAINKDRADIAKTYKLFCRGTRCELESNDPKFLRYSHKDLTSNDDRHGLRCKYHSLRCKHRGLRCKHSD